MAFGYYKSITMAAAQAGTADSSNWPLAICLDGNVQAADADLKTVGNGGFVQSANGYDIRPYSDSSLTTALTFELVYYQATTGKLEMHVKIPTLSHSVNTVIYLAFGDSSITTDGSSNATWSNSFNAVYHMKDGTTLSAVDSTSSGFNGTISGATAAAGEMDGCASFDGINDTITIGSYTNSGGEYTFSAWISNDYSTANGGWVFDHNGGNRNVIAIDGGNWGGNAKGISYFDGTNVRNLSNTNSITTNTWTYISITLSASGTAAIGYLNGVAQLSTANSDHPMTASQTALAARYSADTAFAKILIDEFRSALAVRTASWLLSDYNSQKASSTFITWGSKVATGHPLYVGVLGAFDIMY